MGVTCMSCIKVSLWLCILTLVINPLNSNVKENNTQGTIMENQAQSTIKHYYEAFNKKDVEKFLSYLTDDVVHDINQNGHEIGKEAFRRFMDKMNKSYEEKVVDLVIFTNENGTRSAAEFYIEGKYLSTDAGLPPATGQKYRLRCGAFFDLKNGKIARVTNYYNMKEWLGQVE
jgi:steroid delta-isomerase-like uncharacterized protein